jgi:3'(2'), 5'-bisphosphate nucleotidase
MKENVRQQILTLNPEKLIGLGGSGRKCLSVLFGESDIYIYVGEKTKKWDTCAGEALINCFGVKAINSNFRDKSSDWEDKFTAIIQITKK